VARVRQARRCSARRTDGQPCGCFAILGGRVCRVHGGAAGQVRAAARRRRYLAALERDWEAHQARVRKWHERRCRIAAEHLGIGLDELTPALLGWASAYYADVDGIDDQPVYRVDRRRVPRLA
jgi:hypothetical protein